MEFKKKIKQRMIMQIVFLLLILIPSIIAFVIGNEAVRDFVIPFAMMVTIINGAKIYSNIMLLRNEGKLKKREITEKDERNLSIAVRARGITFYISVFSACFAILMLSIFGYQREMQVIMYCLCYVLVVYYAVYHILQRKY